MKQTIFWITLLALLLEFSATLAGGPIFSDNFFQVPLFYGLNGRCLDPVFADLNGDGILEAIYEKDQVGPHHPVMFDNSGTNQSPLFTRDENTFAFLSNLFFQNMRLDDVDDDGDKDLILIQERDFHSTSYVLLFRNIGSPQTAVWNTVAETLLTANSIITDYHFVNLIGDHQPEVVLCGFSPTTAEPFLRLFRTVGDSLVEVPNYFVLEDSSLLYSGNLPTPTRISFFRLPPDTSWLMILNIRQIEPLGAIGYDYYGGIFRNTGSSSQPFWQNVASYDGEMRVYPEHPPRFYWQQKNYNGSSVLGLRYLYLFWEGNYLRWQQPEYWMKGQGSFADDLAAFDWKQDGQPDILLKISNSWTSSDNFGYYDIDVFPCLANFSPDTSLLNFPFDASFPHIMPIVDIAQTSFDLTDMDGDGDTDFIYFEASGGYNPSFQRIYFNTGNDTLPQWNHPVSLNLMETYFVTAADLNRDGLTDLIGTVEFAGNDYRLSVYRNTGTSTAPQFDAPPQPLLPLANAHPAFADLDADGDPDMVVRFTRNYTDSLAYFRNDGTGDSLIFTRVDSVLPANLPVGSPLLQDVTGDSLADLLILTRQGKLFVAENTTYLNLPEEHTEPVASDFRIFSAYPNPFNGRVAIPFITSRQQKVTIQVFDVRGRLVNTILKGAMAPGNHTVYWDGRDGFGQPVSSGVYFLKIVYSIKRIVARSTQKIVLLR